MPGTEQNTVLDMRTIVEIIVFLSKHREVMEKDIETHVSPNPEFDEAMKVAIMMGFEHAIKVIAKKYG